MSSKRSYTARKKPAPKPFFNMKHPEIADKVEFAFKVGNKNFYRFNNEYQIPAGRYKWIMNYLREVDLRIDLKTMKAYMSELVKCLDGSRKQIDLSTAFKIIFAIQTRLELAFEPETVKRLALVTYFDDTEDLSDFNPEKAEKKRKLWEKYNTLDFFLTKPMSELLGLNDISIESLQDYINKTTEIIKELTSPVQPSQPDDISGNGKKT